MNIRNTYYEIETSTNTIDPCPYFIYKTFTGVLIQNLLTGETEEDMIYQLIDTKETVTPSGRRFIHYEMIKDDIKFMKLVIEHLNKNKRRIPIWNLPLI